MTFTWDQVTASLPYAPILSSMFSSDFSNSVVIWMIFIFLWISNSLTFFYKVLQYCSEYSINDRHIYNFLISLVRSRYFFLLFINFLAGFLFIVYNHLIKSPGLGWMTSFKICLLFCTTSSSLSILSILLWLLFSFLPTRIVNGGQVTTCQTSRYFLGFLTDVSYSIIWKVSVLKSVTWSLQMCLVLQLLWVLLSHYYFINAPI